LTVLPRAGAPRLGLFGLLGSGNSGNDASMETVLGYFRDARPDVVLDAMSGGQPDLMRAQYGLDAVPLYWYTRFEQRKTAVPKAFLKALGKGLDVVRTMAWIRRHDAVIVPGAGALESTLPTRPWGFPFQLLVLCASGKLFGTKVALVSVGAEIISKRATRWLSDATARLAFYRSYRDQNSWESMKQRGIDVSEDRVFPDLVFGVPTPPYEPGDPRVVGIGVMDYYGGNDDRDRAGEIHSDYIEKVTQFATWLADKGYTIRLFGGDSKFDWDIARQILTDVRRHRPGLDPAALTADPVSSYDELMQLMSSAGTIVATRYHNVMCALKLCKPTIALGYSRKFATLMGDMGLAEFSQYADRLDVDRLIEMFTEMDGRRVELKEQMIERNAANQHALAEQFSLLSALLLPDSKSVIRADAKVIP
jgi:polysaccharide pyruvyl transferase WcaK-like protein